MPNVRPLHERNTFETDGQRLDREHQGAELINLDRALEVLKLGQYLRVGAIVQRTNE